MPSVSRSTLSSMVAVLAVCCAAVADETAAAAPVSAPAEKAAEPAALPSAASQPSEPLPPAGGGGDAGPKGPSLAVEEESGAEDAPAAPAGEERRQIGDYIRSHTREIRDCYEKRLQERRTLHGKLVARFDIGRDGRVIGATADGLGDRELALCVVKAVRGWEFEKPQSGGKLRVAYPWVFTPTPQQ
jgi:outer membrane biosynthesis protein TonB